MAARELHPDHSLVDHYDPLEMDHALLKTHDDLDREVDKAMGVPRKLTNERQHQEIQFANYTEMTREN
ncbi:type IIL restriction-modification enzyme MmeI [Corynebacterium ulcerans]|uniref:type IIL restriction-modification enzyme MmeI n=1 Tax=Corynebacterium ulcerans TaxID=65058 RepID=UPI001E4F0476|nr:type IIL restriction-modification enzyme MmeI [Corynebacterium ulcerans]